MPSITFGVASADPASAMFNTTNFQGASSDNLTDARSLFSVLTGRVTSLGGQIALNDQTGVYDYLGTRKRAGKQNEYPCCPGLVALDADTDDQRRRAMGRADAVLPGERRHVHVHLTPAASPASAPTASAAGSNPARPAASADVLAVRFGQPRLEQRLEQRRTERRGGVAPRRAGWWLRRVSWAIPIRPRFAGVRDHVRARRHGGLHRPIRRESRIDGERDPERGNGLLVPAGETWPVFFTQKNRLGPPVFSQFPAVVRRLRAELRRPIRSACDRTGRTPSTSFRLTSKWRAKSFNLSFQRSITRNTAIDIRCVGTRGVDQWTEEDTANSTSRRTGS